MRGQKDGFAAFFKFLDDRPKRQAALGVESRCGFVKKYYLRVAQIRYRGYYYDTDINKYYLKTRWYDPETCRFLNMDGIAVVEVSRHHVNGLNLYVYANNNPIKNADADGQFFKIIRKGASGIWNIVTGAASTIIDILPNAVQNAANVVAGTAQNIVNNIANIADAVGTFIGDTVSNAVDMVTSTASTIGSMVTSGNFTLTVDTGLGAPYVDPNFKPSLNKWFRKYQFGMLVVAGIGAVMALAGVVIVFLPGLQALGLQIGFLGAAIMAIGLGLAGAGGAQN